MVAELTLPRQGWSMDEAAFVEWLKKDGDPVRVGDPVFSVETEKAVVEIESLDAGILRLPPNAPQAGDTVQVGDVLGYLVTEGEATPSGRSIAPAPRPAAASGAAPVAESPLPAVAAATVRASVASRAPAVAVVGWPVSPRAARRAVREGVDLRAVRGTGRGGRIREADVLAALKARPGTVAVPAAAATPGVPPVPGRDEPVTARRRAVAERMHRSKTLTAPVTLTTRADASALVRRRDRLKTEAGGQAVPTYGDMILREVAQTLLEHPALNARWEEDHIRFPGGVSIGFAVDTEAGLVAPVVHDAPKHSLEELAGMTRDLTERARRRQLSPEELAGGTFTITNLGMVGVDAFTPIINWPECAVLGIGRITREPVVEENAVVIRERLWLSLTFDHRIVDGAPAARFLEAVRRRIENPR